MNIHELIARQKEREADEAPSLANIKLANAHTKLQEKKSKIARDPYDPEANFTKLHGSSGDTDLLDLGEASLYQSGGLVMDALRGMSNWAFDTNYDDSMETGWSNQKIADSKAGVTQEYRRQLQEDQQKVVQHAADGNAWEAIKAAADVSTRTLFDSAGVVPELAAGAGLAALGGALGAGVGAAPGMALLARRGQKVLDTGEKIFEAFDDARNLRRTTLAFRKPARQFGQASELKNAKTISTMFEKAMKAPKALGKGAIQTSIVNMEMVQSATEQIRQEYGDEAVTPGRVMGQAAINAVTLSVNPAIIKHLYLPKVPGAKAFADTKGLTKASLTAANEIRKSFQSEVKRIVGTMDQAYVKTVANAVIDGGTKVLKAGGAEALQEYAQTWGETLGVHVGQNNKPFWEDLVNQMKDEGNISEAVAAGLMGGFAGGQLRGVTAGPVTAARVFTESAAKFSKVVGDKAAEKVAIRDFAQLTPERQAELEEEVVRNVATAAELEKNNAGYVDELKKAESLADITNEKIIDDMMNRNKEAGFRYNLNDPASFKAMKEGMIERYNAETQVAKAKVAGSTVGKVVGAKVAQGARDVGTKLKDVAKKVLPDDWQQQMLDLEVKARNVADDTVDFIAGIDVDEVRAFADVAIDQSLDYTKENAKKLRTMASKLTIEQLRHVSEFVSKKNPDVGEEIAQFATDMEQAETRLGARSDRILNYEQLSTKTKMIAEEGIKDETVIVAQGNRLMKEVKQKPGDIETVQTLKKAFKAYEQTDAFKNRQGEPGILKPANIKNAMKALDKAEALLETPVQDAVKEAATDVANAAVDLAKAVPGKVKEAGKFLNEAVTSIIVGPKKKRYKVKTNAAGKKFIETLEQKQSAMSQMDDVDAIDKSMVELMKFFTDDATIPKYKEMFDTQDSAVIADIIKHYMPAVPQKELLQALNEKWDQPATELGETVTKKEAKVKDTGSIPLTPDGSIKLDEADVLTIDQVVSDAEKAEIWALKTGINICS